MAACKQAQKFKEEILRHVELNGQHVRVLEASILKLKEECSDADRRDGLSVSRLAEAEERLNEVKRKLKKAKKKANYISLNTFEWLFEQCFQEECETDHHLPEPTYEYEDLVRMMEQKSND